MTSRKPPLQLIGCAYLLDGLKRARGKHGLVRLRAECFLCAFCMIWRPIGLFRLCRPGLCALGVALFSLPLLAQSPRLEVIKGMLQRPNDPWPRGKGHAVLAVPGCLEANKGYHEPGGSFSPSFGSFGVSIWITGDDGKIQATSDTMPIEEIQQKLLWQRNRELPAIQTETRHYRALWSFAGEGRWQLHLHVNTNAGTRAFLLLRSAGPAGGPVRLLDWSNRQLRINQRWSLTRQTTNWSPPHPTTACCASPRERPCSSISNSPIVPRSP